MLESQGAKIDEMHAVVKKREDRQDAAMAHKLTKLTPLERIEYDRNLQAVVDKKAKAAEDKAAKEVEKAKTQAAKDASKRVKDADKAQKAAEKAIAAEEKKTAAALAKAAGQ